MCRWRHKKRHKALSEIYFMEILIIIKEIVDKLFVAVLVDIISQLRAARNAIKTIELGVLETHVDACITDACANKNTGLRKKCISEIMELIKKYE